MQRKHVKPLTRLSFIEFVDSCQSDDRNSDIQSEVDQQKRLGRFSVYIRLRTTVQSHTHASHIRCDTTEAIVKYPVFIEIMKYLNVVYPTRIRLFKKPFSYLYAFKQNISCVKIFHVIRGGGLKVLDCSLVLQWDI